MSRSLPSADIAAAEGRARRLLLGYALILIVVGISTFPLQAEVVLLARLAGPESVVAGLWPALSRWLGWVAEAVAAGYGRYPLLQYGTDWLAFAHIIIGLAFLGAARAPVRNVWVVEWGMIACLLVVPTALIFGAIREIPFFWRLLDCAFGVLGIIPLWTARQAIGRAADPAGRRRQQQSPI